MVNQATYQGCGMALSFEPIGQVVQARTPGTIDGCMTGLKSCFAFANM